MSLSRNFFSHCAILCYSQNGLLDLVFHSTSSCVRVIHLDADSHNAYCGEERAALHHRGFSDHITATFRKMILLWCTVTVISLTAQPATSLVVCDFSYITFFLWRCLLFTLSVFLWVASAHYIKSDTIREVFTRTLSKKWQVCITIVQIKHLCNLVLRMHCFTLWIHVQTFFLKMFVSYVKVADLTPLLMLKHGKKQPQF